jgi:hypothetical protein
MRWSWRANALPVVLDALLEGSLVGVPYLALVLLAAPGSKAPLPLVAFWLAAGAGLLAARWRPRHLKRVSRYGVLAFLCGVAGWLAAPAARDALLTAHDPMAAIQAHPAGCLLGLAVLLGAIHRRPQSESQVAARTLTIAFPVLAVSLLLLAAQGDAFGATGLIGSVVCIEAGLLAIGRARMRELEGLGSVARGKQAWPALATAVVAVAALAMPVALLAGTSGHDSAVSTVGPLTDAGKALAHGIGSAANWLGSILFGWLPNPTVTTPIPTPRPAETPISAFAAGPHGAVPSTLSQPSGPGWEVLVVVSIVILVVVLLIRSKWLSRGDTAEPPPSMLKEERHRSPRRLVPGPRLRLPGFLPRIARRRSHPKTAAAAYLALLNDLAGRADLARRPAETPRDHVRRIAALGLPHRPLGLLAADYELAVYGRREITAGETRRALGRWKGLRKLATHLPSTSAGDEGDWRVPPSAPAVKPLADETWSER